MNHIVLCIFSLFYLLVEEKKMFFRSPWCMDVCVFKLWNILTYFDEILCVLCPIRGYPNLAFFSGNIEDAQICRCEHHY